MESIGETLREARHAKQASLEDVERATKIKVETLEWIEADEFNRLISPIYARGFLKMYAQYLGLDPQQIIEAYLASQGGLRREGLAVETEATVRARGRSELQLPLAKVVIGVAGLTVIALVIWLVVSWLSHRPASQPVAQQALPKADFEAYYQPKKQELPQYLDLQ